MKYEGANPTGTQKDRIARIHAQRAREMGFGMMTVGTCGNYGAAIVEAAAMYGIEVKVYVPTSFHAKRLLQLGRRFELIRTQGFVEDSIQLSVAAAKDEGMYDANPGSVNSSLDKLGYSEIAKEIVSQLGGPPDWIVVPVGNGTTIFGIYWGFKELARRAGLSFVPRFVGVAPAASNPIVSSFLRGSSYVDLDPQRVEVTEANEPVAGYHSVDGVEALEAIRASGGVAVSIVDAEAIMARRAILEGSGLDVLPCSAAAVAAAWKLPSELLEGKSIVGVTTGRPVL